MAVPKFGIGQPMLRKEDDRLLRGAGQYVADVAAERPLHAVVVRSSHAHARFRIGNLEAARARPGVRLILTAADLAHLGPLPCPGIVPAEPPISVPDYPVLTRDVVRYVGDAVAFVVAETPEAAKDGAETILIDWRPLPHVIGAEAALQKGAPQVWASHPGNIVFDVTEGDAAATREAFARAVRTAEVKVVNQRLVANYMETRGVIAEHDGERYTLTLGSQGSHIIRDILCDDILRIAHEKMRVVTLDVGGGFGTKLFPYREYELTAVAAEKLRRPVRWIGERSEHFLSDSHGREIGRAHV